MTARCSYRGELIPYLDLELDPNARRALESHLVECEGCSHELERQRALSEALAALHQVEPPADFAARFWARLARESDPQPRPVARLREWPSPLRLAIGLGGAAALTAAVLLFMRTPADPDPDWSIVVDAESYELLEEGDLDLLEVLEILEEWDGSEDI